MESLGHFIFELIKIAILGFIYSTILHYIYKQIPKNKKSKWSEKLLKSQKKLWFYISIFFFFYMFTPYGNHGLGDQARIPISLTTEISNINWKNYGRLNGVKSAEMHDIDLTRFKIENNTLCGNLNSDFYEYKNSFFIYDIDSENKQEFKNEDDYNEFAQTKNLPKSSEFKSFEENYRDYWSGWRFFLLP